MRSTGDALMPPFIEGLPVGDYSGPALLVLVALLVITDKLVWHKRLDKVEARAARLEEMLFRSLGVTEKAVTASEVTHDVLTKLPDPANPGGT